MALHTRFAGKDDWDGISRISRESGYMDYIGRMGPSYLDWGKVMVAEDGNMLGFIKVEDLPDRSAWLSGIRVDVNRRREGIGMYLTDGIMKYSMQNGLKTFRMAIHNDNTASVKLAEKLGFSRILDLEFYEGTIDISGLAEVKEASPGYLFYGWKVMDGNSAVQLPGKILSGKSGNVFYSNRDNRITYHVRHGNFDGTDGEGVIAVARGNGNVSGIGRMEGFDEASIFELTL